MGENMKSHANVLQKLVDQTEKKSFQSIQDFPILLKLSWLNFSFSNEIYREAIGLIWREGWTGCIEEWRLHISIYLYLSDMEGSEDCSFVIKEINIWSIRPCEGIYLNPR